MSNQLFKCLLSHEFVQVWGDYVVEEMFSKELQPLFRTLLYAHDRYEEDITLDELKDIHISINPTLTNSTINLLTDIIDTIKEEEVEYNPEIAKDVIQQAYKSDVCRQIINLMADLEAGISNEWDKVQELQDKLNNLPMDTTSGSDSNRYDVVDLNTIDEYIKEEESVGEWKFNIPEMQQKTTGLHRSSHTIIAARPEAGKTAFSISLACAPSGFIHQGANVHIWRNEEKYQAMARRAVSSITQIDVAIVHQELNYFKTYRDSIEGNLTILKDKVTSQKSITDMEEYIRDNPELDILIVDQIDNVRIKGSPARNDVALLEELYARIREIAIKYNIAILSVTQAGSEADNKYYFGYNELYGSKTGKAATADTILCLGYQRPPQGAQDCGRRVINYAKNKFGGSQSCTTCFLTHNTSTFISEENL